MQTFWERIFRFLPHSKIVLDKAGCIVYFLKITRLET